MSAFALILGGGGFGWLVAWLILKERLAHYRDRIDHYKDLIGEKSKPSENKTLEGLPSQITKTTDTPPAENTPPAIKEFIGVDAKFLIGLFEERTNYQGEQLTRPYFGKWLRIKIKVENIARASYVGDDITIVGKDENNGMILATFTDNLESIRSLKKSEQIEIQGEIHNISELFVSLSSCGLISPRM